MTQLKTFSLNHAGIEYAGLAASPSGQGPFPAVLVFPSAAGIGHQVPDVIRRLAGEGYLAVGCDMYGCGADMSSSEAMMANYNAAVADRIALRALCAAWHAATAAREDVAADRIFAMGYCFGGTCVLEMARDGASLRGVASFHGGLQTSHPARPGAYSGEIMVWHGMADPFISDADVAELRAELGEAGLRYQLFQFSGVGHSFTDPQAGEFGLPGIAYDSMADEVSWAGTMALFAHLLK